MRKKLLCAGAALLSALLLLTACSQPASSQDSAAETTVTVTEAEEPVAAAHAALTGFLDACIAHDISGVLEWSDYSGSADESIGRGNTAHAADSGLAEQIGNITITSYSVENMRQANLLIAQQFAEKAYTLRSQAQTYQVMYPEYYTRAADTLETVTDGYLFEITADQGISAEIPVVCMNGRWQADIWVIGSLSDLAAKKDTETGTAAGT